LSEALEAAQRCADKFEADVLSGVNRLLPVGMLPLFLPRLNEHLSKLQVPPQQQDSCYAAAVDTDCAHLLRLAFHILHADLYDAFWLHTETERALPIETELRALPSELSGGEVAAAQLRKRYYVAGAAWSALYKAAYSKNMFLQHLSSTEQQQTIKQKMITYCNTNRTAERHAKEVGLPGDAGKPGLRVSGLL
jgi:hypothetical protein